METPLRIAVCEDIPEEADWLLRCILEGGIPAECKAFSTGEALAAAFLPGQYDLIFLDIYMDEVQQGITAATKIREMDTTVTLAFTTTSKEHALESYRLKACAYLEKPVRPADVREVLEQAINKRKNAPAIRLLIEGAYRELPLDSILYFEQKNHAVWVNTRTETLRTSQTVKLGDIEPQLPEGFFRCHHSYIVNLRYVRQLDQELRIFQMQNGDTVYIRRPSLGKAVKAYESLLFSAARGGGR